jgi:hypothetical protein
MQSHRAGQLRNCAITEQIAELTKQTDTLGVPFNLASDFEARERIPQHQQIESQTS